MASKGQLQSVVHKVDFLEQQRQKLHKAVDEYLDHAVSTGKSWVHDEGRSGSSYQDICTALDNSLAFVLDKSIEMSAGPGGERTDVDKFVSASSQAEASSLPTSSTAPATSPQPPPPSSYSVRSSSSLSDHLLLKLEERVEMIESEMSTMTETMEELTGVKTDMDDMKKKIKKCEETNTKTRGKLTTLKTRFDCLLEQFNTSSKEYKTNRSKDYNWFKKFEEKISGLDEDVQLLTGDVKDVEKTVKKSEESRDAVDREVLKIEKTLSDIEKEKEEEVNKIRTIEERMKTCETKMEKVEELDERISCIEEERRGKESERMNKVEERLDRLEEERIDVEIQRIGVLEDRLLGLEEERTNDLTNLDTIKRDVSAISTRVEAIEKRRGQDTIGFSARLPFYTDCIISEGRIVTDFKEIVTNKGDHYNPSTGIFTAPVDGLYVTTVSHTQGGDKGGRSLVVYHNKITSGQDDNKEVDVCESWTYERDGDYSTGVSVVDMKAGNRLYVKRGYSGSGNIKVPSGFSCFLVG